ncbi:hypothetical protein [Syntrophomonas erecta]
MAVTLKIISFLIWLVLMLFLIAASRRVITTGRKVPVTVKEDDDLEITLRRACRRLKKKTS